MKKLLILMLFTTVSLAQNLKPEDVLDKVEQNFAQVNDYEVDVNIKVDVNFLKVPDAQATIYYKQPDKIRLKSEGFALLPKEGLNFSPYSFLKGDYTAVFDREQEIDGHNCYQVKVIPLGDRGDLILTTLWVDKAGYIIRKIESTTKTNGTFSINLQYDDNMTYPLPSKMVFAFNIEKMQMPRGIAGDMDEGNDAKKESRNEGRTTTGKVYVHYSNYQVNTGIPDSIFQDDKK